MSAKNAQSSALPDSMYNTHNENLSDQTLKQKKCVIMEDKRNQGGGDAFEKKTSLLVEKNNRKMIGNFIREENEEEKNERLKKHLEWLKKKAEEEKKKKENIKLMEEIKRLEDLKAAEEKLKREKEREERFQAWQFAKAREKEEKKKQEEAIKQLEEKIKFAEDHIDKDKVIEEWLKEKKMQRQMENEKKLIQEKDEADKKAMRQLRAQLSFEQWKKKAAKRPTNLPKNGFSFFEPKPTSVVKEEWDNNFIEMNVNERPRRTLSTRSLTFVAPSRTGSRDSLVSDLTDDADARLSDGGVNVVTKYSNPLQSSTFRNLKTVKQIQAELEEFKTIFKRNDLKSSQNDDTIKLSNRRIEINKSVGSHPKKKIDIHIPMRVARSTDKLTQAERLDKLNKIRSDANDPRQIQLLRPKVGETTNVIRVKGREVKPPIRSKSLIETSARKCSNSPSSASQQSTSTKKILSSKIRSKPKLEKIDTPIIIIEKPQKFKKKVLETKSLPNFKKDHQNSSTKALVVGNEVNEQYWENQQPDLGPPMVELGKAKKLMKPVCKEVATVREIPKSLVPVGINSYLRTLEDNIQELRSRSDVMSSDSEDLSIGGMTEEEKHNGQI